MTILDLMDDPELFGPFFRGHSWRPWRVFLAAVFGLPLQSADDRALVQQATGRNAVPTSVAREVWAICGRRSGKSRIAAVLAVFLACFKNYAHLLAPGERGTLMVIAADRRQARVVMRFVVGFLEAVPMLAKLITRRTAETLDLANAVSIEIHTASFRATRGYTFSCCRC